MKHGREKQESQMQSAFNQPLHFAPRQACYSANTKVRATFDKYLYVSYIKLLPCISGWHKTLVKWSDHLDRHLWEWGIMFFPGRAYWRVNRMSRLKSKVGSQVRSVPREGYNDLSKKMWKNLGFVLLPPSTCPRRRGRERQTETEMETWPKED